MYFLCGEFTTVGAGAGAVGAGALLGAGAGAVAGAVIQGQHRATDHKFYDDMGYQDEPRIEVEHFRWHRIDMEECKEEVYRQHSQFFCDNYNNVTQSHSDQNPEETQETGTQMHHSPNLLFSDKNFLTRRMIELMKKKEKKGNKINNEDDITFMTANVCSLQNKARKIRTEIEDKQVDVVCLTETFLKDNAEELLEEASGPDFVYQIKNSDACEKARRGVTIMYSERLEVSEDVKGTLDRLSPEDRFEFVPSLVQHKKWNAPILVISLYRPPEPLNEDKMDDFLWDLEYLLHEAKNHKHIIVTGDFNIPVEKMNMFNCFLEKHHLQQHVNQRTRDSGRILDLVITKNVKVSNLFVGPKKISDHYPVFFDAQPKSPSDE
ncbi:uncharacterized protein V6R79_017245 [Siganus canaliculatus]